jgi:protein gp37
MSKSKIEWTERVWNPITGCTKISQGCKNCYAERLAKRFWGDRKFTDILFHEDRLAMPLRWKKPSLVFVNSMSDLFHPSIPFETINKIWLVMGQARQHTFQILTKHPNRMLEFQEWTKQNLKKRGLDEWWTGYDLQNVWIGVSVENQQTADDRIPLLLKMPAAVRFISAEPLLGAIDLEKHLSKIIVETNGEDLAEIDWVIVGGESGPGTRPMHPNWARLLRDQCINAGVKFFFKQWGQWLPMEEVEFQSDMESENLDEGWNIWIGQNGRHYMERETGKDGRLSWWDDKSFSIYLSNKHEAGRLLDGKDWNEMPGKNNILATKNKDLRGK